MSDPDRYKSRGRKERTPEQLKILEMAREKARLVIAERTKIKREMTEPPPEPDGLRGDLQKLNRNRKIGAKLRPPYPRCAIYQDYSEFKVRQDDSARRQEEALSGKYAMTGDVPEDAA